MSRKLSDKIKEIQKEEELKGIAKKGHRDQAKLTILKAVGKEFETIKGDKELNKSQIVKWFIENLQNNQDFYTLDFLRGEKFKYDCINQIRKKV